MLHKIWGQEASVFSLFKKMDRLVNPVLGFAASTEPE